MCSGKSRDEEWSVTNFYCFTPLFLNRKYLRKDNTWAQPDKKRTHRFQVTSYVLQSVGYRLMFYKNMEAEKDICSCKNHCVKWVISWNLRDRDISRYPTSRRSERDVSGNVACRRVSCFWHRDTACHEKSCPGYVNLGVSKNFKGLILNDTDIQSNPY